MLIDFGIIFIDFCVFSCNEICKSPKSLWAKRNDKKLQEQADNCRNMQKPHANNNADIKTSIDILQFVERNQLQQTPSYKMGGGGNRAAWRIQI